MSIRVYADTSVFGGVFDEEFSGPSAKFFTEVREKQIALLVSDIVLAELERSPQFVKDFYLEQLPFVEFVSSTTEVLRLRDAYLKAGIVSDKWLFDAQHVANATIHNCNAIVSWNFKHIVHFNKISLYNGVNLVSGYTAISILTPPEIISYED